MKNQIEAKSQNSERVYRALGRQNRTTKSINHIFAPPAIAPLVIGRGKGIIQGKAPPGSSGAARGHPPALPSDRPAELAEGKLILQFQIQTFNKNQYSNFYKHFNSIIMKKQILILVVALFAVTAAFGQVTINPIGCAVGTEGPLFPAIGKKYTYTVTLNNAAQYTNPTYQWFVTKEEALITGGTITSSRVPAAEFVVATGTYDSPTSVAGSNSIEISWKATTLSTDPYYLVVNTVGPNGTCDPMNMKVYKVLPQNLFTLDLANVNPAGTITTSGVDQCYQNIQAITLDPASNDAKYDFGSNTLVWAVAAANFSGSWTPTVKLDNAPATGETATMTWSRTYNGAAVGTFTPDLAKTTWTTTDVVTVADASGTVGALGETIYIRLQLDHTDGTNQFEGIADQTFVLSIDGVTANNDPDLHWSATVPIANTDCGKVDGFKYDIAAVQTVKQRPNVTTNTLPAPQNFLVPVP